MADVFIHRDVSFISNTIANRVANNGQRIKYSSPTRVFNNYMNPPLPPGPTPGLKYKYSATVHPSFAIGKDCERKIPQRESHYLQHCTVFLISINVTYAKEFSLFQCVVNEE